MRGRDEGAIEKGVEDVEMIDWKQENQEVSRESLFPGFDAQEVCTGK